MRIHKGTYYSDTPLLGSNIFQDLSLRGLPQLLLPLLHLLPPPERVKYERVRACVDVSKRRVCRRNDHFASNRATKVRYLREDVTTS